ncbi:hypothetical protein OD91_1251 [Lutibacter sp. Hel_I_33_5]|nr:hypothetical protein OD91_1251 [Lutibacter sp. Hel_I_33_5]
MSTIDKENKFKTFTKKIKANKKLIEILRKGIISLVIIFITIAFITLYFNSTNTINYSGVFYTILVLNFVSLIYIKHMITVKERENINLDYKIYNLLKL